MSWIFHGCSIFTVGGVLNHSMSRDIAVMLYATIAAASSSRVILMVKLLYLSKILKRLHIGSSIAVKNGKKHPVVIFNRFTQML